MGSNGTVKLKERGLTGTLCLAQSYLLPFPSVAAHQKGVQPLFPSRPMWVAEKLCIGCPRKLSVMKTQREFWAQYHKSIEIQANTENGYRTKSGPHKDKS
jgi:hypothetical protein